MKYIVEYQKWDTEFFKKKCCRATFFEKLTEEDFQQFLKEIEGFDFITIDNKCGDFYNCYLLSQCGAILSDCPMQFVKEINDTDETFIDKNEVKIAEKSEAKVLAEIASNAFVCSRFANDPLISEEEFNKLYSSWVENAFDKNNKIVFTTEKLEGFLIAGFEGQKCYIDLIAVALASRNKNIGTSLIMAAEKVAKEKGCTQYLVGTQSANISAINLYIKSGFHVCDASQIFHIHR